MTLADRVQACVQEWLRSAPEDAARLKGTTERAAACQRCMEYVVPKLERRDLGWRERLAERQSVVDEVKRLLEGQ